MKLPTAAISGSRRIFFMVKIIETIHVLNQHHFPLGFVRDTMTQGLFTAISGMLIASCIYFFWWGGGGASSTFDWELYLIRRKINLQVSTCCGSWLLSSCWVRELVMPAGTVDMIFVVSSWDSPSLNFLLINHGSFFHWALTYSFQCWSHQQLYC